MAKEKKEEVGISAPSQIKGGKAIRVVIRNPLRFSLIAKWDQKLIAKMKVGGIASLRTEPFEDLDEVVKFFKSKGIGIVKNRVKSAWIGDRYELPCGAVLVSSGGVKKFKSPIMVEYPGISLQTHDQLVMGELIANNIDVPFVNVGTFVSFCAGLGIAGINYRKINNAFCKYGDSIEIDGVAKLTCVPIMTYETSAKGRKEVTTNTKYKDLQNKFEAAKDLGIDVDRILENRVSS